MSVIQPKILNIDKVLNAVRDRKCNKCKGNLIEKNGKFGKFLACENYPKCKNAFNQKTIEKMKQISQKYS